MENYKEIIKYKFKLKDTPEETIEEPRLLLSRAPLGYGFRIYDQKVRRKQHDGPLIIWQGKGKERGKYVLKMLQNGEWDSVVGTKPEVEEIVIPARIIVFHEKHMNSYYSVPTVEKLKEVAIQIIKERNEEGYFYKPEEGPKPIDITKDTIKTLPGSMQEEAKKKLESYNRSLADYQEVLREQELLKKALKGDGSAAWEIIAERQGYEYEGYEIVDPE